MVQDTPPTNRKEQLFALMLVCAGLIVALSAFWGVSWADFDPSMVVTTALFTGVVIFADYFPIHLNRGTKASMTNLPIYLGAVLLPVPLAILIAGCGLLIAEIHAQKKRGLLPRDIAATVGQWIIITYISSQIIHLDLPWFAVSLEKIIGLIAGVFSFLVLDILFFTLSNAYILKEPIFHTLKTVTREGLAVEGLQYFLAFLGALAVDENKWFLIFLIVPGAAIYILFKNSKEVREDILHLLEDMADVVDLRDVYTGGHSKRVAELVAKTLSHLNIHGQEAEIIVSAARLHDIGKIGIPDAILKKPEKLTTEEMLVMQTHPDLGANLISKYKSFARGVAMIRHHHERWDGKGYPSQIKGYEIPFGARVIAVADSFDAMTSDRPYRNALPAKQALQILLDGRDRQWDAQIVTTFVKHISEQLPEAEGSGQEILEFNKDAFLQIALKPQSN